MVPTFCVELNLEEVIIACSFVMTPDVEKASSDIPVSVKWQEKDVQEKRNCQPI